MSAALNSGHLMLMMIVLVCCVVIGVERILHQRRVKLIRRELAETSIVTRTDIPVLSQQAIRRLREEFSVVVRYEDNFEAVAGILDGALKSKLIAKEFAAPGFPMHVAVPIGACIGELLRLRCGATWSQSTEFGPSLIHPAISEPIYPCYLALMHHLKGSPGDLQAELLRLYSLRSGESIFGLAHVVGAH